MKVIWNSNVSVPKQHFVGLQPPSFVYMLPLSAFAFPWQSPVVVAWTIWYSKPRIFTMLLFTERACKPFPQRIKICNGMLALPVRGGERMNSLWGQSRSHVSVSSVSLTSAPAPHSRSLLPLNVPPLEPVGGSPPNVPLRPWQFLCRYHRCPETCLL